MPKFIPKVKKFDVSALAQVYSTLVSVFVQTDAQIAAAVARTRCPFCNGPLYFANYRRKPRGGSLLSQCETENLRYSLCCGRRGCRRRVLPPSVRFLGRKVYFEAVVILACIGPMLRASLREAAKRLEISERTLVRWRRYWREHVRYQPWWAHLRSQFQAPTPDESQLPSSLLAHLQTKTNGSVLLMLVAKCLMGATTTLSFVAFFLGVVSDIGVQN